MEEQKDRRMYASCVGAGIASDLTRASWPDLERQLTRALRRLRRDQYLVLAWPGRHRFVQFAADGEGALRAEAMSEAYLLPGEEFDDEQRRALPATGWQAPTHAPDATADEFVTAGSPNHFADFDSRAQFARAARLAVHTLRDIFRVPSPADLEFQAFQGGDGIAAIDACFDQVCRRRKPEAAEGADSKGGDLRPALLDAVRAATRLPDLRMDDDGNIALGLDDRAVWVEWLSDLRLVRIRTALLTGVARSTRILEALDDLNNRTAWVRFSWRMDAVHADLCLPARAFDSDRMRQALQHFAANIEGCDQLLRLAAFGDAPEGFAATSRHSH